MLYGKSCITLVVVMRSHLDGAVALAAAPQRAKLNVKS
jgi:hypothetical protein